MRPRVLILLGAYWPGHEATGPNQSIRTMCGALSDEFDFSLLARDRPFGAKTPLTEDREWKDVGFGRVKHLKTTRFGPQKLLRTIAETPHDLLYVNSFFDRQFSIVPMVCRRLVSSSRRIIIAPRGEFSDGALGLKSGRKGVFIKVAKGLGLMDNVVFHATSRAELDDAHAVFPDNDVRLVTNFRSLPSLPDHQPRYAGEPLRAVFVGRISPVKGLDNVLQALANVRHPVALRIYGPQQEEHYYAHCKALVAQLPSHVTATFEGAVPNAAVPEIMAMADVLVLPSRSENFGHSIFEALAAGTPVVIGNDTPWRGLESRLAGFDLPWSDIDALARAIDRISDFGQQEASAWRLGARAVAEEFVTSSSAREDMASVFHELAGSNRNG